MTLRLKVPVEELTANMVGIVKRELELEVESEAMTGAIS